jgi:hypothetical protein
MAVLEGPARGDSSASTAFNTSETREKSEKRVTFDPSSRLSPSADPPSDVNQNEVAAGYEDKLEQMDNSLLNVTNTGWHGLDSPSCLLTTTVRTCSSRKFWRILRTSAILKYPTA